MAYTWQAVDDIEPIADGTIEGIANLANYGVISGCGMTYSAANMEVTVAAGSVLHNGTVTAVAGNTVTLVADSLFPRFTYILINSTGTAVIISGDPATAPSVPEPGDNVIIGLALVQAGQTIANNITYQIDKRVIVPQTPLNMSAQSFVETSGQKGFFALGAPHAVAGIYANNVMAGMGFIVGVSATSGAVTGAGTTQVGAWQFNTGATSGEYGMVVGPLLDDAQDWTLVWRGSVPSAASQTWFFGAKTNASVTDENGIIAFRISDTGNIIGVCDSGGTETLRDTGATGATECTLRIEVRAGGTIVRFFKDNVQVGADVTTNIPTGNLYAVNGIRNSTTADKVAYTYDLFGWREAA